MYHRSYALWLIVAVIAACSGSPACAEKQAYDPLAVSSEASTPPLDVTVKDERRMREIPLRIYLPESKRGAPVVPFSHGLGGTRKGCAYLGEHWAARGYAVVFLQHHGSDDSVWRDAPLTRRVAAMERAANLENFLLRVEDVRVVLDQLERWNRTDGHALERRLDLSKVGMSGHSFGALTTQAVGGQRYARGRLTYTDARIKAAVAFSPSSPRQGGDASDAFGDIKIPWMLMTGTNDVGLIGGSDAKSRLLVFPALPAGNKYELVLDKAEHSAFSDRPLPGDREKRNPNHHRAILALSTAFWDAYLTEDAAAKAWLDGDGPKNVLEKADRWQKK
jgi:predicted dienelactone hydrolase